MGLVAEAVAEAERQKHNLEALKGSECSPPDPKLGKIGGSRRQRGQARQGTSLGRQINLQTRRAGT
jgi:hypothetical protein